MNSSRRDFLKLSAAALGTLGAGRADPAPPSSAATAAKRFDVPYEGVRLNRVAFPLGGIGAGMICLEGTGALSQVSVRNRPDVENEPCAFAAIAMSGRKGMARVLEGPVPGWKLFGMRGAANGGAGTSYGLPRFAQARFTARFPFATVALTEPGFPLHASLTGWSPFVPGDADASSLPVAALEYRFENTSGETVEAVFSYNAKNFMVPPPPEGTPPNAPPPPQAVRAAPGGFVLWAGATADRPWDEGAFVAAVDDPAVRVNHAWFRGGWWDPLTMAWEDVARAACFDRPPVDRDGPAPGGSLFVPFRLAPGESRTVALRLCWHVPTTHLREGTDPAPAPGAPPAPVTYYRPWYAGRFPDVLSVAAAWREQYGRLRERTEAFARCFHDSSLPPEVMEAVAANLSILKSPTVLRQTDGRLWAWEGCGDDAGCCYGSCTHVWNYAQATAHLFPALERTLRETEFGPSQDARGHQAFRSALPIRPQVHDFYAAADGQLGGIMKVHRDWRISGDTAWLRRLWPKVRQSLDYCIETWDPEGRGWVEEPHHNTYDVEFWGPDGMCTSFYLGALTAAVKMGEALGDPVPRYGALLAAGRRRMETELFDGEYFIQKIEWRGLRARNPQTYASYGGNYSPEAEALLQREGPKYQYGTGCLSDGVLGAWIAQVCGVGPVLDPAKVDSHVRAVHRHNFKTDLSAHANPQRPTYACGREGGLLLCTWPKGGALSLPFVYSNEVWTGIEYQVASHLIMTGRADEGLEIVRACRARYDGRIRNPFDEYECGHWYARALSSYALLQAWSGARYDAVEQVLHLAPAIPGDFRCFLSTATGYGTVGVRGGEPFLDVRSGSIPLQRIAYLRRE
ncbi:MAG TPA: GH116 family glycosyl hydrolase [Opitutaceae bacterium]|nr:GH116 family glycosyl hydrolase [Opitutaceae bacterium]